MAFWHHGKRIWFSVKLRNNFTLWGHLNLKYNPANTLALVQYIIPLVYKRPHRSNWKVHSYFSLKVCPQTYKLNLLRHRFYPCPKNGRYPFLVSFLSHYWWYLISFRLWVKRSESDLVCFNILYGFMAIYALSRELDNIMRSP